MFSLDTRSIFLWVDVIIIAFVVIRLLQKSGERKQGLTNDLSHIPGTWHSRFTELGTTLNFICLRKAPYIDSLHEKYGDIVRLGPNLVAFRDVGVLRDMYGFTGKYHKSAFIQMLQMNGGDHAFTVGPHGEHSQKRKAMIGFYPIPNLLRYESRMLDSVGQLLQGLHNIQGKKSTEAINMVKHCLTDISYQTIMGYKAGAVDSWCQGEVNRTAKLIGYFPLKGLIKGSVPPILWKLLELVPVAEMKEFIYSDRLIGKLITPDVEKALKEAKAKGKSNNKEAASESNCFTEYLAQNQRTMTDYEVVCEVVGHIVASVDTTAMAIAATLYCLATPLKSDPNPFQVNLHKELSALIDRHNGSFEINFKDINTLPYLDSCVKEGLRLFASFPSMRLRIVPEGKGFMFRDKWVPDGTEVGVQSWSMHRLKSVWDKPHDFCPERWLPKKLGGWGYEPGSDIYEQMNVRYMPFSLGTRSCVGKNMALMVMKLIICSLVRDFEIKVDERETNKETMELRDTHVFLFPKSMAINLMYIPRKPRV